ncbi:MAG: hypothetical protein ACRDK5_12010, partial [Solirubrobacterales bacterium]
MPARRPTILVLAAVLALGAFALTSATEAPVAEAKKKGKQQRRKRVAKKSANPACGPQLDTLYPTAPQADRFTMVIRINRFNDIETYANSDEATGGLRPRLRDRDIFLINTRFQDSDAAAELKIANELRRQFPCNRVFALNGLSTNPANTTGYMFSLVGAPQVSGVLLDWEQIDWNNARSTDFGLPAWVDAFNPMLKRMKARLALLATAIAGAGSGQQLGLVPFARDDWNLGMMARTIDRQSARVVPGRRGLQSSQTQKPCQTGAGAAMRSTVKGLFTQYKGANFRKIKPKKKGAKPTYRRLKPKTQKLNLGVQVSFTSTPVQGAPDPVKSVGPSQAADCTVNAI